MRFVLSFFGSFFLFFLRSSIVGLRPIVRREGGGEQRRTTPIAAMMMMMAMAFNSFCFLKIGKYDAAMRDERLKCVRLPDRGAISAV